MINSNKLSLFPDGVSNGLIDIPVEVSKANCGCNSEKRRTTGLTNRPKPSVAQILVCVTVVASGERACAYFVDSDQACKSMFEMETNFPGQYSGWTFDGAPPPCIG